MRVTVCQLPAAGITGGPEWSNLVEHVRVSRSDLVLLPDMPFHASLAISPRFDPNLWEAALQAHEACEARLVELHPARVAATRPVDFGNERFDEGFLWQREEGMRAVHAKARLQSDHGVWERAWFQGAVPDCVAVPAGAAMVGFLIGTELWSESDLKFYRAAQVDLLITPRAPSRHLFDEWLQAARRAAVAVSAYSASSCREGLVADHGWVIGPDGTVLSLTSGAEPNVTTTLDLRASFKQRTPSDVLGASP